MDYTGDVHPMVRAEFERIGNEVETLAAIRFALSRTS